MKQKLKRTLALLLAILIFSGSLPLSALAADDGGSTPVIAESFTQGMTPDQPQSNAQEETSTPTGSETTGGETSPPASSVPSESDASARSTPPPDSSVPSESGVSSQPPPDISASSTSDASSVPAQSESTSQSASDSAVSSSSTSDSTSGDATEEVTAFMPLSITEMSTTFTGKPGDVVDFFVKLNREDVAVTYQWQRLDADRIFDGEGEAIHDYAEGEDTRYIFTLDGMTEEEALAMNPDATWPGIEMYFDQLEKAGGDASQVQIEMNTPNYILNSEAAAAMNENRPLPETDSGAWMDIEGVTESVYSHTVTKDDANSFYRCRITIVDESYIAAAQEYEQRGSEQTTSFSEETQQVARMAAMPTQQDSSVATSEMPDLQDATRSFLTDSMHVEIALIENDEAISPPSPAARAATVPPSLSVDSQWIQWVGADMEYITADTYSIKVASAANNPNWTRLNGGLREDGSQYKATTLVGGNKIQVLSAWYGKTIYIRRQGNSGMGAQIDIPAYTDKNYQTGKITLYKQALRILNVFIDDTGTSFYGDYLQFITDANGYLKNSSNNILPGNPQITLEKMAISQFNKRPDWTIKDAEGNYKYDLIIVGACTNSEPDISGAAAWELKDYIDKGYGFLIGHDTMYGYGGVTDPGYVPDKNSSTTPYYVPDTKINGHYNMAWLMGQNKHYSNANPSEAPSKILNLGDYTDKSTMYGDGYGQSVLRLKKVMQGNAISQVSARCPTNYPYATTEVGTPFSENLEIYGTATHTNQQIAYGTIWLDYASNSIASIGCGRLVTDTHNGMSGTNNFYLATNGNFGMSQIGHIKDNINSARINEVYILANTIMYLAQRQQCQVCQSEQGDNKGINFVRRISSVEQLEQLQASTNWYNYPKNGCYMLASNITLPADWQPIEDFSGHFNADGKTVTAPEGVSLFAQNGELGTADAAQWNLGSDPTNGINAISAADGTRRTGVARVVGYLHELFSTPNGNAYAGYRVEVVGTDGITYSCLANADGKYVLSNLPCTGIMAAHVYDTADAEVTSYGPIRTNVPDVFWASCETTPLYLLGFMVMPVRDATVYEGQTAKLLEGAVFWKTPVDSIVWQYRPNSTAEWQALAPGGMLDYVVSDPEFHSLGDDSYTTTTLTITNCKESWTGYQFRAVFSVPGKTGDTFSVAKPGKSGLLTVQPRPAYVTQAADQKVWVDNKATFTSTVEYWKNPSSGLTVNWEYSMDSGANWSSVTAMGAGATSVVTSFADNTSAAHKDISPYLTTTTLTINRALASYNTNAGDGLRVRAVYGYTNEIKTRTWPSSSANATGKSGILTVKLPTIQATNPSYQKLFVNQNTGGTYWCQSNVPVGIGYAANNVAVYMSTVTYSPGKVDGMGGAVGKPEIVWQYRDEITGGYKDWNAAETAKWKALVPSFSATTTVGEPVYVEGSDNQYRVTATFTLKNCPADMDTGTTHFYFRLKASTKFTNNTDYLSSVVTTTSEGYVYNPDTGTSTLGTGADLFIDYNINIHHMEPAVAKYGAYSDWVYPQLDITAPHGLRTVMAQFTSQNFSASDAVLNAALASYPGIRILSGNQYGYVFVSANGALLPETYWRDFLRTLTWRTYDPQASGGAEIFWYIDENDWSSYGDVYYNSSNGHFYEYISSPGITWHDAYAAAQSRYFPPLSSYGYLMTITSAGEQAMADKLAQGRYYWLGCTRDRNYTGMGEWTWAWVCGPERGQAFFEQTPNGSGGYGLNGMYSHWDSPSVGGGAQEPNNSNGEYYGHLYQNGYWNDFAYNNSTIVGYMVEYGSLTDTLKRTDHSAFDTDTIYTNGGGSFNVTITATNKIYNATETNAQVRIASSGGLTPQDLATIASYARISYSNGKVTGAVTNGTVAGSGCLHTGVYTAQITFPGLPSQYILAAADSTTVAAFHILSRPVTAVSAGNNKIYDGTDKASVRNITFAPATAETGIVAADVARVKLNQTACRGNYTTGIHQTSNAEVPIAVSADETLVLTNNTFGDYRLSTSFTGKITPRGLAVHSLYLDEPDNPRNIKRYDGTTKAVVSQLLLDNVVTGDTVALNKERYSGTYATEQSGETLKPDGTVQDDRDKKFTENPITLTETVALINNEYGDYTIASEQYSGAISRELLGVRVDGLQFTYGLGMRYPPRYAAMYNNTNTGYSTSLIISKLVHGDELLIDPAKTQFVYSEITNTTPVGLYPLEITGITEQNYPVLQNYILWRQPGYLEVTPCKVRITVGDYEKKYGDVNPAFEVQYEYHMPGAYNLDGTDMYRTGLGPSGDTPETAFDGALTFKTACNWQSDVIWANDNRTHLPYPVYASGLVPKVNANGKHNYELEWVSGGVTVKPVEVTVTGVSCVKTYGNADPALAYTLSRPRVKAGDLPFAEARRMAGEDVGNYRLIFSHMYDPNYIVKEGPPVYLEIQPAQLWVNVLSEKKVYGEENPHFTLYYAGFKLSDNEESAMKGHAVVSTSATQKSHVGSYALWPVGMSVKQNKNGLYNYDLIENGGYLTISKRPIDIYADNLTKLVGAQDPELTYHLGEGQFVVDEKTPLVMKLTRVGGEDVGSYDIYADLEEIAKEHDVDCACTRKWDNWNYDIRYYHGKLTIKEPDKLVATVTPSEKYYGEANPGPDAYTLKYYLNGRWIYDTSTLGLTGTPTLTTVANSKSPVGEYPVTVTGISSTLYDDFIIQPTVLTIKPRPMTVTGIMASKTYGEADPPLTHKIRDDITGIEYADGTDPAARVNPGDLAGNIGRQPGEDADVYDTTLGTLANDRNYALTNKPVWFQIFSSWAMVWIIDDYYKYEGDPNPQFEAVFFYLTNGDTPEIMSEHLIFETECDENSPPGKYLVTPYFSEFGKKEENYGWNFITTNLYVQEWPAA